MNRLHLVGFTTDLKNLIFATRRGARTGSYIVAIDPRLTRTLAEVARLEQEAVKTTSAVRKQVAEPLRESKLTPKEIQNLLRAGKTEDQVAKLAETDISWIRKFASPIFAERRGVVEAVRRGVISKPRLGPSALEVGPAIKQSLELRRVFMEPEDFDAGWSAVRRGPDWQVAFTYSFRGQRKTARFVLDPVTRGTQAMNAAAFELAWQADSDARPKTRRKSARTPAKPKSKVAKSKRSPAKVRSKARSRA